MKNNSQRESSNFEKLFFHHLFLINDDFDSSPEPLVTQFFLTYIYESRGKLKSNEKERIELFVYFSRIREKRKDLLRV